MVVGHAAGRPRDAETGGAPQHPVDDVDVEHVRCAAACRVDPLGHREGRARAGEGRHGEAVPRGDDLVVASGLRTARPRREQPGPHVVEPRAVVASTGSWSVEAPCSKVPVRCDDEELGGGLAVVSQDLAQLVGRPGVGQALDPVGVGIERGGEPARRRAELVDDERGRLAHHFLGERVAGHLPPRRAGAKQQGVVVEHLLEVRHDPAGVDGVAREPACELVVHAAPGHRLEGADGHVERGGVAGAGMVSEQELEDHRRREFRCATESACGAIELAGQLTDRGGQRRGLDGIRDRWLEGAREGRGDVRARARTSSSRVRHASSSAASTRRNCSRGKYVPQKNGSPSGVRKTVIGHPPCPVVAVTADM